MRIGLNATCINNRPSGAKQRFFGIYSELIPRLPDVEFVIYEPKDCPVGSWFAKNSNVSVKRTPIRSEGRALKLIKGLAYWPSTLKGQKLDVFERFNLPIVKNPDGKSILTIHDVRGLYSAQGALTSAAYRVYLEKSLRSANHIVTVSETMKKEILDTFPDLPITVVYNGLDAKVFDSYSENDLLLLREKHRLPEEFVLAVGHFEERKNYLRLIDAMAHLRDRGCSSSLVIVGNDSGLKAAVEKRVAALGLNKSVIILTGLSDLEVRCIYRLCSLFVFPSTYEGFGIPILEAMAASCPMVLSDLPVFREITQNRGLYFPADNAELMANAIERGLSSPEERARLVEYGQQRILDFSFGHLADQVSQLYNSVVP
ncbi:MAG: glycosyltransferase family 1 protein [Halioglobus sp.]